MHAFADGFHEAWFHFWRARVRSTFGVYKYMHIQGSATSYKMKSCFSQSERLTFSCLLIAHLPFKSWTCNRN